MNDNDRPDTEDSVAGAVVLTDRYTDITEVASGWGRTIFEARDPEAGQEVLITVGPPPGRMDSAPREAALRREAAILSRLKHRHICRLLRSGVSHDERFFFVTELLEAEPLSQLLKEEGRLEPALAYEIMGQVLEGLAAMHLEGIVHRGICPESILLVEGEGEEAQVMLGVREARMLDQGAGASESALERLGATMGKPMYLAPEQLQGGAAAPVSDLYAWGLTLLECLAGANPYAGDDHKEALARQIGPEPVPMPAALQAEAVGELLERVLQKDPAHREVTASALHEEVAQLLLQERLLELGDLDVETRVTALRKLAEQRHRGALWAIIKCLEDPAAEVRYNALRALDLMHAPDALAAIKPLREDPDPLVARRARLTWSRLLPRMLGGETMEPDPPPPGTDDYYDPGEEEEEPAGNGDGPTGNGGGPTGNGGGPTGNGGSEPTGNGGGSKPNVSRYTDISCPRKINSSEERVSVVVRLTVDRPKHSVSTAALSVQEQRYVKICLEAPDFEVLNEDTQKTYVKKGKDSNPVTFDLRPLVEQKAETELRLDFFQDGHPLGTAMVQVEIVGDAPTAAAEHMEGPHVGTHKPHPDATRADLMLYVTHERYAEPPCLKYTLYGQGEPDRQFSPVPFDTDPEKYTVKRLYEQLADLEINVDSGGEELPVDEVDEYTRSIGQNLWRDLVPADLQQHYAEHRERWQADGVSLLVCSDEPFIPWELMWPYDTQQAKWEDDDPWCMTMKLTRWLRRDPRGNGNQGPALSLEVKAMACLVPDEDETDLDEVDDELAFIQALIKQHRLEDLSPAELSRRVVKRLLEAGQYSWLHVASHGKFSDTTPDKDSRIELPDGELTPQDIIGLKIERHIREARPAFIFNVCHGGRQGYSPTGLAGWANRLLSNGSGLFISPMWPAGDTCALIFSKVFYKELFEGHTVADAVQAGRAAARTSGDLTWIAYSVYAHPNARLVL